MAKPKYEFTNYYYHCGTEWEDSECDSMHNDHCPVCDREIEPYKSKENATGEEIVHADLEKLQKENPPADCIWTRFGDGDEYNEHGNDFTALATAMKENGVKEILRRCGRGVEANGFEGKGNYISLFWGDADANFSREFTDNELKCLKVHLGRS